MATKKPVDHSCSQCGKSTLHKSFSHCVDHRWQTIARTSTPEQLRRIIESAFQSGYQSGHNDTVEACYSFDYEGMACDYFEDAIKDGEFIE